MKKKIIICVIILIIICCWIVSYYYLNWYHNKEYVSYYENGQIEVKWNYKDWKLDWERIGYYENGQIEYKWNYKDWGFDWEQNFYYKNGQIEVKWNYKDWKLDWERIGYYENGQIEVKWNSKDWELNWEKIGYYENGEIKWKFYYIKWKKDWKQKWYYNDGTLRYSQNFVDRKWTIFYYNKDWSLIWTWDETYTDEFDEEMGEYKSIINWLEIYYYDNGQIREISNYKNWELDWAQTFYYEDWQISTVCDYASGTISWNCDQYQYNPLPDSAKISVESPINTCEFVDLSVVMMKNWQKMLNYTGTIYFSIEEDNGTSLKSNEYDFPSQVYTFLDTDLWTKEFQKWLKIKKEWIFYIKVEDLIDPDEKILWRQQVIVKKWDNCI